LYFPFTCFSYCCFIDSQLDRLLAFLVILKCDDDDDDDDDDDEFVRIA